MRKEYIIAGASVAGVAVGFGAGYKYAFHKYHKAYEMVLAEEIAEAKDFYARLNKAGDYATPESAAEKLVGEAATALFTYQGNDIVTSRMDQNDLDALEDDLEDAITKTEEEDLEAHSIFQNSNENIDVSNRNPEEPYIITIAEWAENAPEHDQVQCTYFEGDKVVADDQDKPIADVNRCVGLGNLKHFGVGEDPNTLLIRNERLSMDYEVLRSTGKFAHEVMGFEHSDDTFARSRRKKQLSDD